MQGSLQLQNYEENRCADVITGAIPPREPLEEYQRITRKLALAHEDLENFLAIARDPEELKYELSIYMQKVGFLMGIQPPTTAELEEPSESENDTAESESETSESGV